MENKLKSGLIEPTITPDNYILGGGNVPQVVLQENADWFDYLPIGELQLKSTETWNCTAFGMANAIEILMFRLFGEKHNYSDRFVGIMSGTKEGGNDPHTVCEAIRKHGMIPEEMLPFSDDINNVNDYYSFKGGDKEACVKAGLEWLEKHDFKHEYVFSYTDNLKDKVDKMKTALKLSPLGVALYAWATNENGVYIGLDKPNHWTIKYGLDTGFGEYGNLSKIFDSYDPYLKLADQNLLWVKRFHIQKKTFYPEKQSNWIVDIIMSFINLIKAIWK